MVGSGFVVERVLGGCLGGVGDCGVVNWLERWVLNWFIRRFNPCCESLLSWLMVNSLIF